MTTKVLKGTTVINCHIIAHNTELKLSLAVSKNTGEVFVCYSDHMDVDVPYAVMYDADKNIEWSFIK